MPTGYTAAVADGKITTFKEFALQCARNFGATITMREDPFDTPIPEEFKPSSYYADRLAEAQAELARLRSLSVDQQQKEWRQEHEDTCSRYKRYNEDIAVRQLRYQSMLFEVFQWEPPTPDHVNMKEFMIHQLEESIRFDCSYTYQMPSLLPRSEWYEEKLAKAKSDVAYAEEEFRKELERVKGQNDWIAALRKSLA